MQLMLRRDHDQPPRTDMQGFCLSAFVSFESSCKQKAKRDLLRRGPFNLCLLRRDTVFVAAKLSQLLAKRKCAQA